MTFITHIAKKEINHKFRLMKRVFGNNSFNLLDVGAGNRSASKTKTLFPKCNYYGLDLDKNTNYIESDFHQMEKFYEIDLTLLNYNEIPDNFFDYINMAHVIEHLHNGDKVLPLLLKKLKNGGYFYIEYPGKKSLTLPKMNGTLNFYDDPTHVRVYSVDELSIIFKNNHCNILKCGTRRNLYYLLATPIRLIFTLIQTGKMRGNIFWDMLGFAEYLFVQKK